MYCICSLRKVIPLSTLLSQHTFRFSHFLHLLTIAFGTATTVTATRNNDLFALMGKFIIMAASLINN